MKTPYMTISCNKINRQIFLRLLGVTKEEFDILVNKIEMD